MLSLSKTFLKQPRFVLLWACYLMDRILGFGAEMQRYPGVGVRMHCNDSDRKSLQARIFQKKVKQTMAAKEIIINQSVAILCDGNNIERSIHEQSKNNNTMVNFDTLIPKLLNGRSLNRLLYFREGQNISVKLAERLHENYFGLVIPCHKSADIPLTIKALQLASKIDAVIIMSGDSDYVELVRHLKSEGVRVEIAAVEETSARILLEEADHFYPITKEDWFVYTPPKSYSRPHAPKRQD